MNRKIFEILLLIGIVVLTVFFLTRSKKTTQPNTQIPSSQTTQQSPTQVNPAYTTIIVTKDGFDPKTTTIKIGGVVVWTNKSGKSAGVNSAKFPTNLVYPPLNLGQFGDGQNVSLVFDKAGTYTYYNYFDRNKSGTIIVQ